MANEQQIYFQTILVTCKHPESGETYERVFPGRALLTPEEFERYKDKPVQDLIIDISFDKPVNPYEDEGNAEAHQFTIRKLREMLRELEEKDG